MRHRKRQSDACGVQGGARLSTPPAGIGLQRHYLAKDGTPVLLRQAVPGDAVELIRAIDSVAREGVYFLRSHFEVDAQAEEAFIAAAEARGDLILVATVDGQVVGWVTLFRGRAEFQQHTAELGIGVVGIWRERGIGRALMEHALACAAERGIEKIKLGVRPANTRARALYSRLGFAEEGYRVRDVKDAAGGYDDIVEMAWFAPGPPAVGPTDKGGSTHA